MKWFSLLKNRQEQIIRQTAQRTGNLPIVIEKDIWVCIVLKLLFESELKDVIIFKGGTSLSKGYNIIKRFSEDIDIAIDKAFFGFKKTLSNTQIDKLRKTVYKFTADNLMSILYNGLIQIGVLGLNFSLAMEKQKEKKDPVKLVLSYRSAFAGINKLKITIILALVLTSLLIAQYLIAKHFSPKIV